MDCDGHISELIPLWIESGMTGTSPVEIASEQDVVKLALDNPDFVFEGGIDKRVLSRDKKAVEEEVMKKMDILYKRGGWIPGVDHAVPADAKFENFAYLIELLKKGW